MTHFELHEPRWKEEPGQKALTIHRDERNSTTHNLSAVDLNSLTDMLATEVMFTEENIQRAAEKLLADDLGYCECRRNPFDKHDVNPPCSSRRKAVQDVRAVVEVFKGAIH